MMLLRMMMNTTATAAARCATSIENARCVYEDRDAIGALPWLPMTDPGAMWAANLCYLAMCWLLWVIVCGRGRRNVKEHLRPVLLVYNAACVGLAGYVCVGMLRIKWAHPDRMHFVCNPTMNDPVAHRIAHYFTVYYLQKFFEYADTWFFILRGSMRQVTFLHVYHHVSITVVLGCIFPYEFSGDMYLPVVCNSFVHVLLYGHYFASALGVRCWWRRYLTTIQLAQFALIATQSLVAWWSGASCGAPDHLKLLLIGYMATMLGLFGHFYAVKYSPAKAKRV